MQRRQAGLSLVELIISISVGLVLTIIVLQIFAASRNTYRSTENQSRLQENGRYIIEKMSRDIRIAGYAGCTRLGTNNANINNLVRAANEWLQLNQDNVVRGMEHADLQEVANFGIAAQEVKPGSDVIRIIGARNTSAQLTGNMDTENANIQITGNPDNFARDDILIISDCNDADVFRATTVANGQGGITTIAHAADGNTDVNLSKTYGTRPEWPNTAEIMRLSTTIYYIGAGVQNGCPANTLCRNILRGADLVTEPLIQNVEQLQLLYGEDMDGDGTANRVVLANEVQNWAGVISVQINLILRSQDDNIVPSAQTYTFMGQEETAQDRRIRRPFSTTVAIRGRVS